MSQTFDRSQLDGKDREQLSGIATALGVKSISRMRKAELIEAITAAVAGSNGTGSSTPRKVRSTVTGGGDDFASIAEEENVLVGPGPGRRDGAHPSGRRAADGQRPHSGRAVERN